MAIKHYDQIIHKEQAKYKQHIKYNLYINNIAWLLFSLGFFFMWVYFLTT